MMKKIYKLNRDFYGQDSEGRETTLGKLIRPDGTLFGYVLEDVVRAFGIKVKGKTAIPEGRYKMSVMDSPKYGRVVTLFTDQKNGVPILENGGVKFSYIRAHGGNHADHTDGCLLVNKNRETKDNQMAAWGALKDVFAKEVGIFEKEGNEVFIDVINLPQSE